MLNDKVVLITGASSGIGSLLAQKVSALGAMTILTGRNELRLTEARDKITGQAVVYVMDVQNLANIESTVEHIVATYGKIDILINNAGYGKFAEIDKLSVTEYEQMMDTNYMGVVRCTKAVLPIMERAGRGHIVNIASLAGMIGSAKSTSYAATKHAVLGFTNSLRMELRGGPIKVSAVNPGPINTEFFHIADPNGNYVKNISWMIMQPEYVVKQMIKLLYSQRAELNIPRMAAFGLKLYQLCPRVVDKIAGKYLNKK